MSWPQPPESVIRQALKWCRCCPECAVDSPPCQGSMVTGFCDNQRCSCNDEPDEPSDEEGEL